VKRLPPGWYRRDVKAVARDLLGRWLRRDEVTLRITEVEAYLGPQDSACHTAAGRTARNAPMWGPGGHAYVYLCYGIHHMLNVVTGDGDGAAVLIRSCEPVEGLEIVRARRGGKAGPLLLTGPGKVGQALALDIGFSGHPLFEAGGLELLQGAPVRRLLRGRRVGIEYARPADARAPLRFADADSEWVSRRMGLRPFRLRGREGVAGRDAIMVG
jgi:DNA-3-methyladenine glycosylase